MSDSQNTSLQTQALNTDSKSPSVDTKIDAVDLLVTNAKSDTSAPPSWSEDKLLIGVEKLVIGKHDDPARFHYICQAALSQVESPAFRAEVKEPDATLFGVAELILLGVINGLRRVEGGDMPETARLFQLSKERNEALPNHPRKDRLLELYVYQEPASFSRRGLYGKAAEFQQKQADNEQNTPAARAIAGYLAVVYTNKTAIVAGDTGRRDELINKMTSTGLAELQSGVKGSSEEVRWGYVNGPWHVVEAMILANKTDRDGANVWTAMVKLLREYSGTLGGDYAAMGKTAEIADLYYANGANEEARERALNFIGSATGSLAAGPTVACARLILGQIYQDRGNKQLAAEVYQSLQPAPDLHMVAAEAARRLAALNK